MRAGALGLFVSLLFMPMPARSNPSLEADLQFADGLELMTHRKYDRALRAFLASNRLAANPAAIYNAASCLEYLGRLEDAFEAYAEYLRHPLSPELRNKGEEGMGRIEGKVARLSVQTEPPGARIYFERVNLGLRGHTPKVFALPPGRHTLILELDDHVSMTSEVEVVAGKLEEAHYPLSQVTGRARVVTRPPGALALYESRVLGHTPLEVDLPVGRRALVLTLDNHLSARHELVVGSGDVTRLDVDMVPVPPRLGRLRVTTSEPSALVRVDGVEMGFSPLVVDIPPGRRVVRVEKVGYLPLDQTIEVLENHLRAVDVWLAPERGSSSSTPWIIGAVGGSALAAGVGLGIRAQYVAEKYAQQPTQNLYDSGRASNLLADVMYGAAALSGVALLTWALTREPERTESTASSVLLPLVETATATRGQL